MKYSLALTPAADADIDEAAQYIARDSVPAALRFYDAVDQSLREIALHPRRSPRYELKHPQLKTLRKRAVSEFRNYLVFFTVNRTSVLVLRVLHGARDISSILRQDLR